MVREPVVAKTNLPGLLRAQLADRPPTGDVYVGSRCDPYIPMEADFVLTRRCLEILSEHRVPTYLVTKADPGLISRDLEILSSFQGDLTVVLGLTNLTQILESESSGRTRNVAFARRLHSIGIRVWAHVMPVLPGITDVHAFVDALPEQIPLWLFDLQMAPDHRAAAGFLTFVERSYPHLVGQYRQMLAGSRNVYYEELWDEFRDSRRIVFPYG